MHKKRSLDDTFGIDNATFEVDHSGSHQLLGRYLRDQRGTAIGTYLDGQSGLAGIVELAPDHAEGIQQPTFCKLQVLANAPLNSQNQWLAGTANTLLTGCSVLAVCSSRAVYIASHTIYHSFSCDGLR